MINRNKAETSKAGNVRKKLIEKNNLTILNNQKDCTKNVLEQKSIKRTYWITYL